MNNSQIDKNTPIKKKVKGYTISFCPKEHLGRSLYGDIRLGIRDGERKVIAFRVNSLPISQHIGSYLSAQQYYGNIKEAAREVYDVI